jgi:hypothetical protein
VLPEIMGKGGIALIQGRGYELFRFGSTKGEAILSYTVL